MKRVQWFSLAVLAMSFVNSAKAVSIPGWERPVQRASLEYVSGTQAVYPRVVSVTMNQHDGAEHATSFTLAEDTGIRCITAPCPSSKSTVFTVQKVKEYRNGKVEYLAYEKVRPLPNVRLAARALRLTDYTNAYPTSAEFGWDVRLNSLRGMTVYGGNPEPVYTIQ